MTNLQTDATLLRRLAEAATQILSAEEINQQRISFIMGSLKDNSTVTRAKISEVLAAHEGRK